MMKLIPPLGHAGADLLVAAERPAPKPGDVLSPSDDSIIVARRPGCKEIVTSERADVVGRPSSRSRFMLSCAMRAVPLLPRRSSWSEMS